MSRTVLVYGFLFLMLLCVSTVEATGYNVDGKFTATHSLATDSDDNRYYISSHTDERIKYDVEVESGGKFKLYLIQGYYYDDNPYANYYVDYSTDDPVSSFSKTFYVDEADGNEFTIMISTDDDDDQGVTYNVEIDEGESSFWENFQTGLICCGILLVIAIPTAVIKGLGKGKGRSDPNLARDVERARQARIRAARNKYSPSPQDITLDQLSPDMFQSEDQPPPPPPPPTESTNYGTISAPPPAPPPIVSGEQKKHRVRQPVKEGQKVRRVRQPVKRPPLNNN